ncbi:MAG: hypothetical protein E7629_01025 [Ruminococcaceae bacterium]|nr:hypothetical protein [Oscillospiraceae bacterium]
MPRNSCKSRDCCWKPQNKHPRWCFSWS